MEISCAQRVCLTVHMCSFGTCFTRVCLYLKENLIMLCSKYDYSNLPPEDDEDYIDIGSAILQFYSSLVELLARCAPDAETIKAGRSDSLRARAILRSLVSMEDLEGVLGLRFILPLTKTETVVGDDGEVEQVATAGKFRNLTETQCCCILLYEYLVEQILCQVEKISIYLLAS